jgi:hypothetical protein
MVQNGTASRVVGYAEARHSRDGRHHACVLPPTHEGANYIVCLYVPFRGASL